MCAEETLFGEQPTVLNNLCEDESYCAQIKEKMVHELLFVKKVNFVQ